MDDQEFRLGIRIDTNAVDPATRKVRELRKELQDLERSDSFTGKAAVRADLTRQLAHAERGLAAFKAQATDTGQASSKAAMGVLTLANSVQDFQAAGLRGVLNNIPMLVAGLGGGAGLAGTAMLAAVAFDTLNGKLINFNDLLGKSEDDVANRRQSLVDKAEAVVASAEGPTDAARARQTTVNDAVRNAGGITGLAAQLARRHEERSGLGSFMPDKAEGYIRDYERSGNQKLADMFRQAATNTARENARKHYEDRLKLLMADPSRQAELLREIGNVQPGVAASLSAKTAAPPPPGTMGGGAMMTAGFEAVGKVLGGVRREIVDAAEEGLRAMREATHVLEEIGMREATLARARKMEADEMQQRLAFGQRMTGDVTGEAAQYMAMLMGDPRIGGGGMSSDDAYHTAAGQLADRYSASRVFGGMGMSQDDALALAYQQMQAAMPFAEEMAAANREMNPDGKELARQTKELVQVQRRALQEGVPIRLRKTGWR
jgi:hypothetical protein